MSLLELRLTQAQTTVQNLVAMPSLLQSHKIVSQFLSKYPGDSNSLNFPLSCWALSRDVCAISISVLFFVPAPPNSWSAAHDTPRVHHAVAYEDSHCAPASGVSRHELTPKELSKLSSHEWERLHHVSPLRGEYKKTQPLHMVQHLLDAGEICYLLISQLDERLESLFQSSHLSQSKGCDMRSTIVLSSRYWQPKKKEKYNPKHIIIYIF